MNDIDVRALAEETAERLFADLCEGDGEHSEALDRAIITAHVESALACYALDREAGWQPIETAKRDGRRLLVWAEQYEEPITAQWYPYGWGVMYGMGPLKYQPTHWRDVPTPPPAAREGQP